MSSLSRIVAVPVIGMAALGGITLDSGTATLIGQVLIVLVTMVGFFVSWRRDKRAHDWQIEQNKAQQDAVLSKAEEVKAEMELAAMNLALENKRSEERIARTLQYEHLQTRADASFREERQANRIDGLSAEVKNALDVSNHANEKIANTNEQLTRVVDAMTDDPAQSTPERVLPVEGEDSPDVSDTQTPVHRG